MNPSPRGLLVGAVLIGLGVGGLFDGIVFHQILGWHHLVCNEHTCRATSVADLEQKNLGDGLFHAACWLLLVGGLARLATAAQKPGVVPRPGLLFGGASAGWGAFNLIEGLIDHQILGIHHVHPGRGQGAWDAGFLGFGLLLLVVGWRAARASLGPREPTPARGVQTH